LDGDKYDRFTHVPQPNLKNRILDSAPKALLESSPAVRASVQPWGGCAITSEVSSNGAVKIDGT
jgi:hypothetical protein